MDKSKYKKLSLIERSALTFQSYLNSEVGNRFYTDQFLTGVTNTRMNINNTMTKTSFYVILSACALAYFEFLPQKISILSNEFTLNKSVIPIINVFMSLSLCAFIMKFIDSIIINRYVSVLGNNISIFHFDLFLIDKNPPNLFVDPLLPRVYGPLSDKGHKATLPILGLIFLAAGIILYGSIVVLSLYISYETIFKLEFSIPSFVTTILSIIFILLSIVFTISFSLKYKFLEAEFEEFTLEPTEYLKAKQEAELAADTNSRSSKQTES